MLRVNPASTDEGSGFAQSPKHVAALALMACSLFWTGCAGFSQGSLSSQQLPQPSSGQTVLPSATVGRSYHDALAGGGTRSPYIFNVSKGTLPPGLVLDSATGSISGIPTRAGSFTFSITVTGGSVGLSTQGGNSTAPVVRPYAMSVLPSVSSVTVQISPLNPSVAAGGKVQFSATVRNTSNTAVTWSASAGTISSAGLFTAPASGNPTSITITASSVAGGSAQASTAVTITSSSPFVITTSSVPSALVSTAYSTSLAASGGQTPYQWNIASGSLPAGVQLNATTGMLSGSPTQSGTFPFTARVTDAASHTAQQSLSLVVATSGKTCGPPAYECSRSDLSIVQVPAPPSVGNLAGANTIVTDPDFGNRIVRITDANTNPAMTNKNITFVTTSSGSADDNLWNIDSTLFTVQDTWADTYVYSFNPTTLQASRLYVSNFPATSGLMLSSSGNWSRSNSNILYTDGGTALYKYDFTDRSNPPSPQLVYDFTSSPNCLPAGFTPTWNTKGGVSGDDTVFAMAYSNTGDQGTGVYAVVYKVGSGCSVLNTQTGQVSGDWGAQGTINIADRWTIHNVKLSKDGTWLILESTNCTSSACGQQPYFWQVGTTTVNSCGQGGIDSCGGHFTEGYSHWVNNNNSPMSNQVFRAFSQPSTVSNLTNSFPPGITPPFDQHQSWNNVDPADALPLFTVTWSTTTPFPAPWYNEIIAVAADGSGKTWRFAHDFTTTHSQRFSTAWAIGTISQDGRFFIFSSDWMGNLGSESGAAACTIGTDCRGDVFVVELK